ncbi:MAG: MFS transporter [Parachlamydiales bacterium]|jgi:DHA3 family tetracycline resistance protein-like MFS transporter
MKINKHDPIKVYSAIRFASALLFSVIVTVNLVYQATVVGLNPLQMVLVGTMLETVSFLFEVPTGIVADVYSRKLSVMIGLLLIGLGFTVEGLFPFFGAILIAQIIWGIGFTFVSGAREAWIADEIGEEKAGKAYSKGSQMALIGSLIGIGISMFLANINIRLPIILGGILYSFQSLYLFFFMPEENFHPIPIKRRETFGAMKDTLVSGLKLIKVSPVLLTIVATGLIFGMFSEGFDRLWTPFMLNNFVFPTIWNLKPVIWFGILAMVANVLAILAIRFAEKRTDTNNHKSTVTTLLLTNGMLVLAVIVFALSGNFVMAIIAYWLASMFREVRNPFYDAWMNQNVESKVRATVFSMCSQANAVGQIAGGPILGLIATAISLRVSIALAGLILIPTLFLYAYSIKKHKLVGTGL